MKLMKLSENKTWIVTPKTMVVQHLWSMKQASSSDAAREARRKKSSFKLKSSGPGAACGRLSAIGDVTP